MPPEAAVKTRKVDSRRYVGTVETVAYVLYDSSKSFNINSYSMRFVLDVLKIDLYRLTFIGIINGIWDIINDTFIGVIVDKTRTRWGKFRPYLIAFAIPGTVGACLYWMAPLFFGKDPMDMGKFMYWLILAMTRDGAGTFQAISEQGFLSTITPSTKERVGLITMATVLDQIWQDIPEISMGVLIDLVNHHIINVQMRNVYLTMGLTTSIICGVIALGFFLVAKERVMQTVEKPNIIEGMKTIIRNKPMLLMMLSDFFGAFSISTGMSNYYIDVLGAASIANVVRIIGAPMSFVSFSYVTWARRKFSTRALWIFGAHFGDFLAVIVFFVGSIGGKGKNGLFRKAKFMIPFLMIKEGIWLSTWGVKKVIPKEMFNETMDYCEWQNGCRTEGMTIAARSFFVKLVGNVTGSLQAGLLKFIGYDLTAGFGTQTDATKYNLFAMSVLLPVATGILGLFPKFFYDLSGEKKERMYEELYERRKLAEQANEENKAVTGINQ
jgi:Na+/melibiose symporter-like transporter